MLIVHIASSALLSLTIIYQVPEIIGVGGIKWHLVCTNEPHRFIHQFLLFTCFLVRSAVAPFGGYKFHFGMTLNL